ncbi:hypothetical protein MLD38_017684 [Melastoma candidum]|uniref:Uncharacterized protein n=1 Tax=Melastoma candidum TaxID=119954 RepID=A0ACB9QVH4_9MYRT|nr:hypothetical protein MLD38_017684 [Melastoma candidum]
MRFPQESSAVPVIALAIAASVVLAGVEASRTMPEDSESSGHLSTMHSLSMASAYKKLAFCMTCWLERLESGPSPEGPGH